MTLHDVDCPSRDDFETERLRELDWRYTPSTEPQRQGALPRVGEVCTAAIIALAHAYQPIEHGYNGYYMATLDDDFDYDTLGQCITEAHERDLPNLSLDSLRLVDRMLSTYESVMVDSVVVHAPLVSDDDTRSRWEVEASISLRCRRMVREVERQLHVDGTVNAAEAALEYVGRLHGTPTSLLRKIYA